MSVIFKFNGEAIGEPVSLVVNDGIATLTPESILPENVEFISIEFKNTGGFIPAFVYSQEELDLMKAEQVRFETAMAEAASAIPADPAHITAVFPTKGKYFSPRLLEELNKFPNLNEINIISNNVVEDDSFPTHCSVNIIQRSETKEFPRAVVPTISTPAELFALMQSTNVGEMAGTYTLMNDIDMTGFTCESIGRNTTAFTGTFNGQGYTVRIADVSATVYGGFFGIFQGSVQNLNVVYTNTTTTFNGIPSGGVIYNGGLLARNVGTGNINNCNVVYEGNVIINGQRNGGFANSTALCTFTDCSLEINGDIEFPSNGRDGGAFANVFPANINNFTMNAKGDIKIAPNSFSNGGCISTVSGSQLNGLFLNCKNVIVNDATATACIYNIQSNSQVDNLIFNCSNINISNVGEGNSCIDRVIGNSTLTNAVFNCGDINVAINNTDSIVGGCIGGVIANSTIDNIYFKANNITLSNASDGYVSPFLGYIADSTVSNCNGLITGDVSCSTQKFGGFVTYAGIFSGLTTISNCNCIYNKNVVFTGTAGSSAGGLVNLNQADATFENCSVFYGANVNITADTIGGIAVLNDGSHTNSVVVYNNYTFTGTTVDATFASGTGTETDCYVNTFSSDTSVIPNTNTTNVLTTLSGPAETAWLAALLNIRQNINVANNTQFISDIFTLSTTTDNEIKNNALSTSMTFGSVPYITTTPSVIQPLLVKYSSILPSSIRYAAQNSSNQVVVSDTASYYIYQNPAYIVPANKTILSSTEGNGSVAFDTEVVPVDSDITIDKVIYKVKGVGSSLLEVTKPVEPVKETSSNPAVIFAIIAGVILVIVLIFSYLWGWKGYMILPLAIAITFVVLAIVAAI